MALKAKKHTQKKYCIAEILNIPEGKQDFSGCMSVNEAITRLAKAGTQNIVINLEKVTNIDNLFINMLLSSRKYCDNYNKAGSRLSICGMEPDTLCVFYLLKLDKHFEFYENTDDALKGRNRLVRRRLRVVS